MRYTKSKYSAFSTFSVFAFIVTLLSLALLFASRRWIAVADFLNGTLCFGYRRIMAAFADLFGFSLFEILVFLIPVFLVIIIVFAVKIFKSGVGRMRFILNLFSVVLLFYSGHVIALGISYNTTTVDKEMGFETVKVTEENLAQTMILLRDEVNTLVAFVEFSEEGSSFSGYSMDEISDLICKSYVEVSDECGFVPDFSSSAKAVGPFSIGMSYLGITGIYTYFTGEANVNMTYPDYDVVFTAAHELSHQRGILRENEANFMAYLVCSRSEDVYLRYCAALNMYQYVGSALYRTNKDLYYEISHGLDERAKGDIYVSNSVTQKYGDTILNDISDFVNDLFLKSNGTAGIVTYGRVVILAVSYLQR